MVFGAATHRLNVEMLSSGENVEALDPWVSRMRELSAFVVSNTLDAPLDWPNATIVGGDAVDVVARLKEESDVPLRSHGSLSLNRLSWLLASSTWSRSRSSLSSPASRV